VPAAAPGTLALVAPLVAARAAPAARPVAQWAAQAAPIPWWRAASTW